MAGTDCRRDLMLWHPRLLHHHRRAELLVWLPGTSPSDIHNLQETGQTSMASSRMNG
jgi:hypothetical protein